MSDGHDERAEHGEDHQIANALKTLIDIAQPIGHLHNPDDDALRVEHRRIGFGLRVDQRQAVLAFDQRLARVKYREISGGERLKF